MSSLSQAQQDRIMAVLERHGRRDDAMALRVALQGAARAVQGPSAYPGAYPPRSIDGRYRVLSFDRQPRASALRPAPYYFKPANPFILDIRYFAWINALGVGDGSWLEWI